MKSSGDSSAAPFAEDLTGATVGRYVICSRLGAGAMGEVYLALHTQLRHYVAIKRLAPKLRSDEQYHLRFLREGQRASALNHSHIARVYDVLEEKGELLLVMEYVEGTTLRQHLKEKPMGASEFLEAAIQCGEALDAAHQKGILHGDIKPDNIMLTPEHQVKVLDFGVARRLPVFEETAETQSLQPDAGTIAGTPAYIAPEVLLLKQPDARADVFSLGVVFYEMLSGKHPFLAGGFTATTDRILHEEPPPLSRIDPDVPETLSQVVARALAKDPEARYASAGDLVEDLRALQRGEQPGPKMPSLLTIVFTDVVESSATKRDLSLGRDSRERDRAYLEKVQSRHFNLVRDCCRCHGGREVNTMGDAFYLVFEDPVEATRCALEIHRRLAAEPIETPRGPLRLRIGLHSGFPEFFEGTYHGADVDTAARVEGMATAQQVVVSSTTYELVRHMSDVKFHRLGEFALKGVERILLWEADWDGKGPRATAVPPLAVQQRKRRTKLVLAALVAVLILVMVLVLVLVRVPSVQQRVKAWRGVLTPEGQLQAAVPHEKNLAVLPFTVVGEDTALAAFGSGLAATLNAKLTQLTEDRSLQVIPASEMRDKGVTTLERARQEFGVNLGLRITLDRSAAMIRIAYSLIDAETSRQLRGKTITEPMSDVFAIEDSVADSVVKSLEIELKPQGRQVLDFHGTNQPAAYDYYLQGRGYLAEPQKVEDVESAITVFNEALTLDKNYALAYAGLGEAYWRKWQSSKHSEWVTRATEACTKSVTLDDRQAQGHYCLGLVYSGRGKYEDAIREYRRAVEIEPTSDQAYRGLGLCYDSLGMFSEAEKTYQRAIDLRPHYWAGYNWLGILYETHGRLPEAAHAFKQLVKLAPDSFVGYNNLGGLYFAQGRYQDAISMFERSVAIRQTAAALSNLGTAYFYQRRFDDAAKTYEKAVSLDARNYEVWGNLGDAYWASENRAQAAKAYRTAISLGEKSLDINPRQAILIGYLALYHAMLGDKKEALDYLRRALQLAPDNLDLKFTTALVYNQFENTQDTLRWLENSLVAGYSPTTVRDTPAFEKLKANSRFQALLKKR